MHIDHRRRARIIAVSAAIACIGLVCVSCSLFLFPFRERLNHLDPKTDLVYDIRFLHPIEDGYVVEENLPTPSYYEGGTETLSLDATPGFPRKFILLLFDFKQFPYFLVEANLTLKCSLVTTGGSADIEVFRIMKSWSPGSVTDDQILNSGFLDNTMPANPLKFISDANVGDVIPWDSDAMTLLVQRMIEDGMHYGILIEPRDISIGFHATEKGGATPYPPRLEVEGWFLDE